MKLGKFEIDAETLLFALLIIGSFSTFIVMVLKAK
jgi:hypothetical protein